MKQQFFYNSLFGDKIFSRVNSIFKQITRINFIQQKNYTP